MATRTQIVIADAIKIARDSNSHVPAIRFLRRKGMTDDQVQHVLEKIFPLHEV